MIDERFYGQALREAESGVRRDDIWAKALATSNGELDRIRSVYIELLAQHLANTSANEERMAYWTGAKRRVKKYLIILTGALSIFTVALITCNALYQDYKIQWLLQYGDTLQAQHRYEPRRFFDKNGKQYIEPTIKEMWDIELASEGLISSDNFSDIQMDLYQMSPTQLYLKYGEPASTLIMARSSMINSMFSVRLPSMWEALLSGFRVR